MNILNNILAFRILCLSAFFSCIGCSFTSITNPRLELAKFDAYYAQDDELNHLNKAKEFIRYAKDGRVEDMMRITSSYTLKESGVENVKEIYAKQLVRVFKNTSISWKSKSKVVISKQTYGAGWDFFGSAHREEKPFDFRISVFKENEEYVISSIKLKPRV